MTMSVTYTTVGGMILHENRGGTERYYRPDTIGSVATMVDSGGTQTDSRKYWPYGSLRQRSGSGQGAFGFVGTLGYFNDSVDEIYVRSRYYSVSSGTWMTKDLLWPSEPAYRYASGNPLGNVDPTGLKPWWYNCVYKWLYTGDCHASDEVYEAALEGGFEGASCYASCMADFNKALALAIASGLGFFGGGIPKSWFGIPVPPGASPYTSIASLLHYLAVRCGLNPGLRPLLRKLKDLMMACVRAPALCAKLFAIAVLLLNVLFAAICAARCSQSECDSCDDGSSGTGPYPAQLSYTSLAVAQ